MSSGRTGRTCVSTSRSAVASTPVPVPAGARGGQITIRRMLDRMSEIRLDETVHGPAGARNLRYEPTFLLRGLSELRIEFSRS